MTGDYDEWFVAFIVLNIKSIQKYNENWLKSIIVQKFR